MEQLQRLKQEFPSVDIKEIPGGANLYTRKGVVTVYFRKRKFMINQSWKQFDDFERFLFEVSAFLHVPKPKGEATGQLVKEIRVQDVIDHINRKIEFGRNNGMSNSNLTLLLTLTEELKQYLP